MDQKKSIVDLWSFLHQPMKFNKTTFKKMGKKNGILNVIELPNSLQIHAKKHYEIVELGRKQQQSQQQQSQQQQSQQQQSQQQQSQSSKLSDEKAYLLGIKTLLKYLYNGIRKGTCEYEIHSTEKRTRFLFMYNENKVIIVLDHNRHCFYKRDVSAVTCYYKIY